MRDRFGWFFGVVMAVTAFSAVPADAAWEQVVPGPLNANQDVDNAAPSLAMVGGVPYVAWVEKETTPVAHDELRVARLNSAGTAWEQPWGDADSGGLNISSSQSAASPSIADVAGVPYVAWSELDATVGGNSEIRVKRLNLSTNTWTEDWTWDNGGILPVPADATHGAVNHSYSDNARDPELIAVGSQAYVAWVERDSVQVNDDLRVARLEVNAQQSLEWNEPWSVSGTNGGINEDADHDAVEPDLTVAGGVPYLAFREQDAINEQEVRVAKLVAGPMWDFLPEPPPGGSGGIGNSPTASPSIAVVGGVPYVAWDSAAAILVSRFSGNSWSPVAPLDSTNAADPDLAEIGGTLYGSWNDSTGGSGSQLRVARLTVNAWTEIVGGASPINTQQANLTSSQTLVSAGGVPWISWAEVIPAGSNPTSVRVGGLEPEFVSANAVPTATGATLLTTLHTYGFSYPVGFEYGTALGTSTATQATPAGSEFASVSQTVDGLASSTAHQFRGFATAGVPAPRVLGQTGSFTTLAGPPSEDPPGGDPPATDAKPPTLIIGGKKKQKLRRNVTVTATCSDEACALAATGRATVAAGKPKAVKRFGIGGTSAEGPLGKSVTLPLKLPKRAFRAASAALADGGRVSVTVTVTGTDAAGNAASATRRVALRPR